MSDMIQTGNNPAERAWLFQQQASSLINAVENRELISSYRNPSGFQGGGQVFSITLGGSGTSQPFVTGSTGTVVLIDTDYPTGGLAIYSSDGAGDRIKPEWGSSNVSSWARWVETTKDLLQGHGFDSKPVPSTAAKLRVDRLTQIQAVLGLSIQTTAEILGVTRQGLYKWLDVTKEITLQEASRQRLAAIERLSKLWSECSKVPLASVVHESVKGGRSVLQMLTDAVLDEAAITSAFDELAKNLLSKPKSLSQRMADSGFKRRPSTRSLPADE